MRIKEIAINGLFGMFDHAIRLNHDERLTILTSPNGLGKTTILRILANIFSGNPDTLQKLINEHFTSLIIETDENSHFYFEKTDDSKLSVKYISAENEEIQPEFVPLIEKESFKYLFNLLDDSYQKTEGYSWIDIGNYYGTSTPVHINTKLHNKLHSVKVQFIETQRLIRIETIKKPKYQENEDKLVKVAVIGFFAFRLSNRIQTVLAQYAEESSKLDSTFPKRLMENEFPVANNNEIITKLTEIDHKRKKFVDLGLLDETSDSLFKTDKIDEKQAVALTLYINDNMKKLSTLDNLAGKLELFRDTINKLFSYKRIYISKEKGFIIKDDNNLEIPPAGLSSGEQHQIVMLYNLLFGVAPGSLILIDEPELSLHVAWQMELLDDLQKIANLMEFDIIVATHSPQIINDKWDLTVELKGKEKR